MAEYGRLEWTEKRQADISDWLQEVVRLSAIETFSGPSFRQEKTFTRSRQLPNCPECEQPVVMSTSQDEGARSFLITMQPCGHGFEYYVLLGPRL